MQLNYSHSVITTLRCTHHLIFSCQTHRRRYKCIDYTCLFLLYVMMLTTLVDETEFTKQQIVSSKQKLQHLLKVIISGIQ